MSTVGIRYSGMKSMYETKSFRCHNSDTRLYLANNLSNYCDVARAIVAPE
jgi:hypothetical protein